jgi:hypothetical protein
MLHLWRRGESYTAIWWGNMRKRYHMEDPDIDGRIIMCIESRLIAKFPFTPYIATYSVQIFKMCTKHDVFSFVLVFSISITDLLYLC